LLSFGIESIVFHFAIQKSKDSDIQNYNFAFICMGVKIGRSH